MLSVLLAATTKTTKWRHLSHFLTFFVQVKIRFFLNLNFILVYIAYIFPIKNHCNNQSNKQMIWLAPCHKLFRKILDRRKADASGWCDLCTCFGSRTQRFFSERIRIYFEPCHGLLKQWHFPSKVKTASMTSLISAVRMCSQKG